MVLLRQPILSSSWTLLEVGALLVPLEVEVVDKKEFIDEFPGFVEVFHQVLHFLREPAVLHVIGIVCKQTSYVLGELLDFCFLEVQEDSVIVLLQEVVSREEVHVPNGLGV